MPDGQSMRLSPSALSDIAPGKREPQRGGHKPAGFIAGKGDFFGQRQGPYSYRPPLARAQARHLLPESVSRPELPQAEQRRGQYKHGQQGPQGTLYCG